MFNYIISSLSCFIRQKRGGIMLTFAIVLPMILSFCALVFDGAQLMMKRARLEDSLNEGALIAATASPLKPTNYQIMTLNQKLADYIRANFTHDSLLSTQVLVNQLYDATTDLSMPSFTTRASLNVSSILPLTNSPSFGSSVLFSEVKGKATKFLDPNNGIDFTFVVNLGGSMGSWGGHNDSSGSTKKEVLMKAIINDIIESTTAIYPTTTFTLVPTADGVPVKIGKNELGGDQVACSYIFKPKKLYDPNLKMNVGFGDLEFDRWAAIGADYSFFNKFKAPAPGATSLPYTMEQLAYHVDLQNYFSFSDRFVFPYTAEQMVAKGWCVKNEPDVVYKTRAPYSCSLSGNPEEVFTPEGQKRLKEQGEAYRRTMDDLFNQSTNVFKTANMDGEIDDVLNDMFDAKNIINIPVNLTPNIYPSYNFVCASIAYNKFEEYSQRVATTTLIKRTTNKAVLSELENWPAGISSSSTYSGMIRAVPEMLEGANPRKAMVVITTGRDDYNAKDPMRDILFKDKKLCDRIRDGVKSRTNAKSVDIYVISIGKSAQNNSNDPDYIRTGDYRFDETKYWSDYCTGTDKVAIAGDYKTILLSGQFLDYEETGLIIN